MIKAEKRSTKAIRAQIGRDVLMLAAMVFVLSACGGGQKPPILSEAIPNADGTQSIQITARNGYEPSHIQAEAGKPLLLEFYRDETAEHTCVSELVIPEAGVDTALPPKELKIIRIEPQKPGEMTFKCGMDMIHGKITFLPPITPATAE